ncbi:MAG: mannose-1-phosphate guanylyltransferase [Candidatus Omnitrophica bacterium]|nr:mannose-1-phosphate guanylyltransferase [Candidatus Omnitrophota bacterium]
MKKKSSETSDMKKHLFAIILAGGTGTRFWPQSRKHKPKQFLNILGPESLYQQTLKRVQSRISGDHIFVVTNKIYKAEIFRQSEAFKILKQNVLLEPSSKNTAPAIYWAASLILNRDPDAVIVVLPSDHFIAQPKEFLKVLDAAASQAALGYLVTLGIIPTRPETGYGYIKGARGKGKGARRVERFIEKPDAAKAKQYVQDGNYYWNAGIFIFKAEAILAAFKKYLPRIKNVEDDWEKLPSISIDYGILEKADNVVIIPAENIGWSDVGSWESLMDILPKDKDGNVFKAKGVFLDCHNTFISGERKVVSAVGLKDLIVIDTHDALLICPKEQSQNVKQLVAHLSKQKAFEPYV